MIIGHHPHVVQEIEEYNGKYIFYSLGNFIFDQYFSKDTQEGLLVQVTLEDEKLSYTLLPVKSVRSQPMLMEGEEKQAFLDALAKRSSKTILQHVATGKLN